MAASREARETEGEQAGKQAGPGSSVLIVDDDADIVASAREVIERFVPGARVAAASSCAAGLAALAKAPVDLAIVDYRMPGRNGLEFVGRAHELEPGLPVILMTGVDSVDVVARAINEHGVEGFLPKPFDAVVLAEAVQKALRRHAAA